MQRDNDHTIGRRPLLKGAGVTLGTLGGLASPVAAGRGKGRGKGSKEVNHLKDTPADFVLYWSQVDRQGNDPNEVDDFGFRGELNPETVVNLSPNSNGDWFLVGSDPGGGKGLFDGSTIEITPNRRTLHHSLRVFAGLVMKGKAKPYTLVNQGGGLFEPRGQVVNFRARSKEEIQAGLKAAFLNQEGVDGHQARNLAGYLANSPPLSILEGGKWRAVADEQLKVNLSGSPPFDSEWAVTRVDFYALGRGKPTFTLSVLYVLSQSGNLAARPVAMESASKLIGAGRLNLGGK